MKTIRISEYFRQYASTSRRNNSYKRRLRNNAKKIEAFEHFLGKDLYTSDFDDRMMEEYDYFLRNDPKNYLRTTIKSFGDKLGEFLRKAQKDGYKIDNRYRDYSFPQGEVVTVALTEEELEAIYNLKGLSKEQKVARFWFLVNCCNAFRFADLKRIASINFVKDILKLRTQKTNTEVILPGHWMIKELLNEYNGFFPVLKTQQNYGAILKRLCRKAQINDKVLIERHEGNRFVRKTVPKWKLVSAHTARRSFATNAYLSGIKVARIMLLTGHKTEESFFKYIKIDKTENAKLLSKHKFFTGTNKISNLAEKEEIKKTRKKVASILSKSIKNKKIEDIASEMECNQNTIIRISKGLISVDFDFLFMLFKKVGVSVKINDENIL